MIVGGAGLMLWAVVTWRWEDPLTSLYTRYQQRELESSYEQRLERFPERPKTARVSITDVRRQIALEAKRYRKTSRRGEPIGRLKIPRLGLDAIVVNGTDTETLKKGPGRDPRTFMPGEGELVYVAGHRTTYGAPFSDIDKFRRGDRVTLELPYATVVYAITRQVIVPATYLAALKSRGREELALQACWPRFFASKRYIAYGRPVAVRTRMGELRVSAEKLAAAL